MTTVNRRGFMWGTAGTAGTAGLCVLALGPAAPAHAATPSAAPARHGFRPPAGPRARVVISNDLGADPDGLFAFVHQVMSPSTEVRMAVGTHGQLPKDPFDTGRRQAEDARRAAVTMLRLMRRGDVKAYAGSNEALPDGGTPRVTAGAKAIVAEANRTDTDLPLYITAGGSLTDVASAYLIDPGIEKKATLVWIGGKPYPDGGSEYNFNADPHAAQVIFNRSAMPIWQVPSDVYSMCMVSDFELERHVANAGAIGRWLWRNQLAYYRRFAKTINFGEVYQLGDSPLVLLTALTSPWDKTATYSSPYDTRFAPRLNADGTYTARDSGRKIRVYKGVDGRLMYADFFAKLRSLYGG